MLFSDSDCEGRCLADSVVVADPVGKRIGSGVVLLRLVVDVGLMNAEFLGVQRFNGDLERVEVEV